jgi:hypothetical protein
MPIDAMLVMLRELMLKGVWDTEKTLINNAGIICPDDNNISFEYLTNKEAGTVLSYGNRILDEIRKNFEEKINLPINKKATHAKCVDLWNDNDSKSISTKDMYFKHRYPYKIYTLHAETPKTFKNIEGKLSTTFINIGGDNKINIVE